MLWFCVFVGDPIQNNGKTFADQSQDSRRSCCKASTHFRHPKTQKLCLLNTNADCSTICRSIFPGTAKVALITAQMHLRSMSLHVPEI
jgi:hypothetical protein